MKRNKQWLRNKNQRKNNKLFTAAFMQNSDGSFTIVGGGTRVFSRKNQHSAQWESVDTRDFATELRQNKIHSL